MKKSWKILATLLLASATLTCAIACISSPNDSMSDSASGNSSFGGHSYSYTETVTAPTCTEDGFTTYTCECGDSYTDDLVEMLGHTESDWIVDKQATYEETGSQHKECTVCHEVLQTEDIPILEKPAGEGLKYTLSEDETYYIVSGIGTCEDTNLIIPSTYEGKPVREIASYAFCGCDSLTSVVIPDSVTSIGDSAFLYCTSLTSVKIGDGVTSIDNAAFLYCTSLTCVKIPGSVTSIDPFVFSGCTGLTSVEIPSGVTLIDMKAFSGCSSLTSVEISDSVTSIETDAFYDCYSLYKVVNNSDLTFRLGDNNNGYVAYYAKILVDKNGNTTYKDDGKEYIETADNFLFVQNEGNYKLIAYLGNKETVTLPSDIYGNAYTIYEMRGVRNVIIPDGVTLISDSAFLECVSLMSVVIPDSVTEIGSHAFFNCSKLTSVEIGDKVTTIDSYAFAGCTSLTDMEISDSVTMLGNYAFYGCTGLTSVIIPGGVTSIGKVAFSYCSKLTSITFQGTKAEWEKIVKGSDWNSNTGDYTIHCKDGDIQK